MSIVVDFDRNNVGKDTAAAAAAAAAAKVYVSNFYRDQFPSRE